MTGRMADILRSYGAEYVPEGYGNRWRPIRCVWHEDKHASAGYNEELDSFKCQACGVGGNAVTLLMKVEGIDARAADALATRITGRGGDIQMRAGRTGGRGAGSGKYVPPRLRRRAAT